MSAFSRISPWWAQLAPASAMRLTYRYEVSGRGAAGKSVGTMACQMRSNIHPSREKK